MNASTDAPPLFGSRACSLVLGIASAWRMPDDCGMGDGRTFGQAVRALDKFIVEQSRRDAPQVPDPHSPVRQAYDRIVAGTAQ
jgi:hypothetical protein